MPAEFVPLRTDPPPSLGSTLWTRSTLTLTMLAAIAAALVTALLDGDALTSPVVVVLHVAVVALLVVWSYVAMGNVDALVPATRYTPPARGVLAGALWVVGCAAPVVAVVAVRRVGTRFADVEEFAPTMAVISIVLLALLVAWLPFRYHVRQAARIGAPHRTMRAWFWAPVLSFVAVASLLALGLAERLEGPVDRGSRLALVYGIAAATFTWSTWRAVTVFDEVIDLRWRRWRSDWEQTLRDMAAQPPPGPERGATS